MSFQSQSVNSKATIILEKSLRTVVKSNVVTQWIAVATVSHATQPIRHVMAFAENNPIRPDLQLLYSHLSV